ncbi:MAG TPA: DinB family protein [bacterium]|nr:DinB family protein [bacterium]HPO07096.1 DinB family protein [bacterium]HQO33301.1 DinB family protein [bacterium]HQP98797.1 DinB family protein [bacterium]
MKKEDFVSLMNDLEKPTLKLASLIPDDKLDTSPIPNTMSLSGLLAHLGDSMGYIGRCLVSGEWPMHSQDRDKPVTAGKNELMEKIRQAHQAVRDSFEPLSQGDFETRVTQTPWGAKGTIEMLSVAILYSHQIHHKMQLFMALKALGIQVDTGTLYMGLEPGVMKT